jgi:hypothetical protein
VTTAGGTTNGSDRSFTTLPLPSPPSVSTKRATAVTPSGATLNGTVNPHGLAITSCRFVYGTTMAYGSTIPCIQTPSGSSTVAVSANVSALAASTKYHFRLYATSAGGTAKAADLTFTTAPPYVVRPPARPDTLITRLRIDRRHHRAVFRFRAIGARAIGFQCALVRVIRHGHGRTTRRHFTACHSPRIYRHLRKGTYVFFVRAIGVAGPDLTPARFRFRI